MMCDELVFLQEARDDIRTAYEWYEDQSLGLGFDFLRAVEACILLIRRHPLMHQTVHEQYRRALLRRFPFALFYEYGDGRITVYAVFHVAQCPEKWLARL